MKNWALQEGGRSGRGLVIRCSFFCLMFELHCFWSVKWSKTTSKKTTKTNLQQKGEEKRRKWQSRRQWYARCVWQLCFWRLEWDWLVICFSNIRIRGSKREALARTQWSDLLITLRHNWAQEVRKWWSKWRKWKLEVNKGLFYSGLEADQTRWKFTLGV